MKVKINRIHISCIVCICIMFLVVFHTNEINAQTQVYPVSVTTQISPPYSVNLSDYAAPGSEQMKVIVLQRDLTQSQYQLYLKMQIELNGRIIVRTSPTYIPPAFVLEPGIPTLISGSSLSPYFDPANMEFTGYSRDQYMRTKLFPEGAYIITFTAFDWTRRDVALSNGGAFYCYLAKTDPPILNLPINNALVQHSSPQYINFQWLSRNLSSPNSAFSTRYKFELFEMRVGGISPSEVVTRTRSIFSAETDRTNLTYSIAEPVLEKGMRYVWRVKAFDTQGKDYIRNNGFSEVFSFVYVEGETGVVDFSAVGNFKAQAVSPRKAKLTWDVSSSYDSYRIYYRKQGNANKWYESESVKNSAEINGLSPGSIYECKVQGKRGNAWGSFSTMDTVGMPLLPVIECGSPFTPLEVANREPLLELMHLQEFDAGGFMVTIADPYALTTSPGRFTGKGFVQVPLFGHKKIRCEFTNIFINTDFRMVEGSIRLITDTNDGKNALWNIDEVFEGGSENGTVIDGTEEVSLIIPDIVITDAGSLMLDTASDEIFVLDELQDTTVRIDVSIKLSENPGTLTIQDSQGNLYSVDTKSGKATSLGKILPSGGAQQLATLPSVVDTRKGKVIFEPIPGQTRFAFDVRSQKYARSNIFSQEYKTMNTEDGGLYDIPYKLIPAGETDVVLARVDLKNKSIKADSIVFRSGTGTVYKTQSSGKTGEYLLTLPSGKANDGIEVSATYTDSKGRVFVLGRLIVMSYEYRKPELVLVPVNGNGTDTDPATIKEMLDKVYLPVAVDWQVSLESNFESKVDSLDIKGSGMFSMYTDGMKALNNAFIVHKGQAFDPSAVYLFLLQVSGEESATGDMPRSKQFGYVFTRTAGSSEAINRTIAHEIAHGAFSLSHTFDSKYDIDQGTTSNLLDYTAGTDLVKHQWDAIHNPGLVVGMFERDEEGMMGEITYIFIALQVNNSGDFSLSGPEIFITPAGKPFLNKKIKQAKFAGTETNWIKSSEPSKIFLPAGCLIEFTLDDNQSFRSVFKRNKSGSWYFTGYYPSERCSEKGFFEDSKYYAECDKVTGSYLASLYIDNYKKDIFANASHEPKGAGLLQAEIVNSISQHSLDYTKFSSRDWAIYNYYGDGSTLIKLSSDRYILFYIDQFGSKVWFEWNGSMWTGLKEPLPPTMKEACEQIFTKEFFMEVGAEIGHAVFDVVSSATGIGLIIASGNTLWYIAEGEMLSAGFSLATIIPGGAIVKRVGLLVKESTGSIKLISYSTKFVKFIEAYGSTYEGAIKNALRKLPDEKLETVIASIQKLDVPLQEQFLKDLNQNLEVIQDSRNLLAANIDKIDDKLVEAWKIINDAGETALRSDISELQKVIANIDDIKNSGGYKVWKLINGGDWITFIGKEIDELIEAPKGYQFYIRNDQKFIRRINVLDASTPQLSVRYGKIVQSTGKIVANIDEIKLLLKTDVNRAFFWSGKTDGIGGKDKAFEIAKSKGGNTLEGLIDDYKINMPEWNESDATAVKIWEDASAAYADQVSGEVRAVVGNNLRIGNLWENIELIRLKANKNVTKITLIDPKTLQETIIWTR